MPSAQRRARAPYLDGDILSTGVAATDLADTKIVAAVYGRNGVGKTTFACQGQGPIALISIEPSPTGGARSVSNRDDITVFRASKSETILAIAEAIKKRSEAGQCPFRKVVIDGVTSWNDVILGEILKVDYESIPAILGIGKVHVDVYTERGEKMIRYLKPFLALPCDLWIVAQERDHNPPKEKTTTRSGKEYSRPAQTALLREAHPLAQEGSFFSLGVSDTQAKFIQDACDFVLQLYEDDEYREEKLPDVVVNGQVIPGPVERVATGRRVKRLRCTYHTNYAARCRANDYRNVPEYIEAATPEGRYAAFLDVVAGRRTEFGHYGG